MTLKNLYFHWLLGLEAISKDAPHRELEYALYDALKHATGDEFEAFVCSGRWAKTCAEGNQ